MRMKRQTMRHTGWRRWLMQGLVGAALAITPGGLAAQDMEPSGSGGGTPLGVKIAGNTTVNLSTGAGLIEARLLTGLVVKEAASRIVDATGTDFTSLTMVVLPIPTEQQDGPQLIGGRGWDVLAAKEALPVVEDLVRVRDGLARFGQRHAAIAAAGMRACRSSTVQGEWSNKGITDTLGSITGVLNAATPLLNLFKQDFTYDGLNVRVREGMLVSAVRGEIAARRKPPAATTDDAPQTMAEAVAAMERQLAALPANARCGDGDGGAEAARASLADEFAAFRSALNGPGSQDGTTLIGAAEAQLRRHGPRPATLVLAIDADGASMVRRTNLGTMFGAETTTISSGIVVSYEFYEPQSGGIGSLKAAGVLSCVSGAVGIRAMHQARKIRDRATCY